MHHWFTPSLADELCQGRLALVLEGGYQLEALSRSVRTVLEVLTGGEPPTPVEPGVPEVRRMAEYHRTAFTEE